MGGKYYIGSKKIKYVSVDWIHLAQDRGKWRALVNTVMKLVQ
jgi:hypothetical protein